MVCALDTYPRLRARYSTYCRRTTRMQTRVMCYSNTSTGQNIASSAVEWKMKPTVKVKVNVNMSLH